MALSDIEIKRIENTVSAFLRRRRPPPHIRPQLDLAYRIAAQSVEIYEVRPVWDDPSQRMEHSVAKATYVRRTNTWKVFWQRADLKWHRYPPHPEVESVEDFLSLVDADEHACFFG